MKSRQDHVQRFGLLPKSGLSQDVCVAELAIAREQWNRLHGGHCRLEDWVCLGECSGRASTEAYLAWLASGVPCLKGDLGRGAELELVSAGVAGQPAHPELVSLLRLPSLLFKVRWSTPEGGGFETFAIGQPEGLRFDPLMACAVLEEERIIPPTERNTDIFHRDFGWIWQSKGSYTRGFVHAELTVVCDGGKAVKCRYFASHGFNLGSSDIKLLPTPPAVSGACAQTAYKWAIATGSITASVTVVAGGLNASFSGTFGSTAGGEGGLLDCCKADAEPVPTATGVQTGATQVRIQLPDGTVISVQSGVPAGAEVMEIPVVHRGRLQVQGDDLDAELSFPWTRKDPPAKAEAHTELDRLRTQLTSRQFERRKQAFEKAHRFIRQAPASGADAVVRESFYNNPRDAKFPDARVDVEIWEGKAFKD